MQTIATNIRFPKDDYLALRLLAFSEGKSTAALIREAAGVYRKLKTTSVGSQLSLAKLAEKISVKIDIPVIDLIASGRKI